MQGYTNEITLAESDPPLTFYYPHDAAKTGDLTKHYPPKFILKETQRLTERDFLTYGPKTLVPKTALTK